MARTRRTSTSGHDKQHGNGSNGGSVDRGAVGEAESPDTEPVGPPPKTSTGRTNTLKKNRFGGSKGQRAS
ncbi:hypothetical protein IFR04_012959 [Cadophora malorum]|uniref:Uncharacterized protein n=1 Tax=Cadophora malorum TaxID=108018 RepID=A0A8H7W6A6_9HELO|nr:hypothetical protein IFR04_012959 [Cadophora malorum]